MSEPILSFEQYLNALPPERQAAIEQVWSLIRDHMPPGYTEIIGPKFLSFAAAGEWYVALANQKQYISLYLMPVYVFPELRDKLDANVAGVKCGKSCINFMRAAQLPLQTIADIIAATPADVYLATVQQVRAKSSRKPNAQATKA